jgi:hypothetical protein
MLFARTIERISSRSLPAAVSRAEQRTSNEDGKIVAVTASLIQWFISKQEV